MQEIILKINNVQIVCFKREKNSEVSFKIINLFLHVGYLLKYLCLLFLMLSLFNDYPETI